MEFKQRMARQEPELLAEPRLGGTYRRYSAELPAEAQETRRYQGIGADLREERERLGLELTDVAAMLRIQLPYLSAIEEGRYNDLPGATYAIGFLRSYAGLLGLDSQAVTEAFKEESSVRPGAKRLVLPEPIQEPRRPRGLAILISILVAGAIYAGWAYLTGEKQLSLEEVPPPPDRLMSLLDGADAGATVAPATGGDPASAAAPALPAAGGMEAPAAQASPTADTVASVTADAPQSAAGQMDRATGPAGRDAAVPVTPPSDDTSEADSRASDVEATPAAASPEDDTLTASWRGQERQTAALEATPPAFPMAGSAETALDSNGTVAVSISPTPASADAGTPPQVYGLASAGNDSRVMIRATGDSWVQVQGPGNELLLTRVLRAGDSYLAPNRSDIVMMTGNAGALEIIVDGRSLGVVGPQGAVMRNISLDPEVLLNGG